MKRVTIVIVMAILLLVTSGYAQTTTTNTTPQTTRYVTTTAGTSGGNAYWTPGQCLLTGQRQVPGFGCRRSAVVRQGYGYSQGRGYLASQGRCMMAYPW
ncbi:MAG: hypothetical protein L3V56_08555 [Candidatus Magnetoovum sp. WYHC-5]|nr:hypothetical protein [Candidatus Magnetoovum sp. WYHC-5]